MQNYPQHTLENFFFKGKKTIHKKGAIILRPDDLPRGAYYLQSGFIKDSAISKDGQEFTLFIFKPQDVFPYQWIFNDAPNNHTFIAMTDCTIYILSKADFLSFIYREPDVLSMMLKKSTERMGGILQRLEYMAFGDANQKIASILLILGERFGVSTKTGIRIDLPLSHKDIAELIGVTRETASIAIKKLEQAGILLKVSRRYIIQKRLALLRRSNLLE